MPAASFTASLTSSFRPSGSWSLSLGRLGAGENVYVRPGDGDSAGGAVSASRSSDDGLTGGHGGDGAVLSHSGNGLVAAGPGHRLVCIGRETVAVRAVLPPLTSVRAARSREMPSTPA